jgi:hypothetical protein
MSADQPRQHLNDTLGPNGSGHIDGQAFPGVFVHNSQTFDLPPVGGIGKREAMARLAMLGN